MAIVALPLLATGVLSTQRVVAERAAASEASALVTDAETRASVAAVIPPSQLERTSLTGLARIDELGLSRDVVVGITGIDYRSISSANAADFETALTELRDRHGSTELDDGATVDERLTVMDEGLTTLRRRSADQVALPAEIDAFFDEFDVLLEQLVTANTAATSTTTREHHRARLQALSEMLMSAGDVNEIVVDGFITGADAVAEIQAQAVHNASVDAFAAMLTPAERIEFDTMMSATALGRVSAPLLAADEANRVALDPERVQGAAHILLARLGYVEALEQYSNGFHERTAETVRAEAAHAHTTAELTQWILLAGAGITVALVGLVSWSVLVPIRRLARRADSVGVGGLGLQPLELQGPPDVRSLTSTMNEMAAVLGRVNDRIRRLASGDIDAHYDDDLPGPIGVSLRSSVQHLASVTKQLHRSKALASAIVDQADDSIWTIDDRLVILSANTASIRLTGCSMLEQIGRPITDFLTRTSGEADVLTRPDAATRVLVAASVVDAGGERVTALIAHDISERSRFEARLTYQAMHDALTGLPNRFALLEHLTTISEGSPGDIAVLYLDLDGFKAVNDAQGHAVGDRVLSEVAQRLAASVGDHEFVGRLGGDEFVVVTRRFAGIDDAMELGRRIVRAIERPDRDAIQPFSLSVSVGIAIPPAGTPAAEMIGQADKAVYQAKRLGRGRVVLFDRDMQAQIDEETELERALGLSVGNDELVLHLQPVFDLATGRASGAEALVRWNRPGRGLVSPGEFIPMAERSSVIIDVDQWVLQSSCERLVEWCRRDPSSTARLSVNISGRHLSEGDLFLDVTEILARTGADPTMLELELTETHLLEDMQRASNTLNQLRSLGITIAVDDFGTGYSSMTYLRELPVDVIKIDRSFVERATEPGYDATVIEALITIAAALDLKVVAEGIENDEQLEYVRSRGCQAAQGFLMARPMAVDDAEAVIFSTNTIFRPPVTQPARPRQLALMPS